MNATVTDERLELPAKSELIKRLKKLISQQLDMASGCDMEWEGKAIQNFYHCLLERLPGRGKRIINVKK